MKTIDDIDLEKATELDCLLLQLELDEYEVTDEAAFNAMSDKEIQAVREWLYYRTLSASDHIIRKKRLIQPEFSTAFLKREGEQLTSSA